MAEYGMVGKIGTDFDISKFYGYNLDLTGVKQLENPTTSFYTYWNSEDGQDREVSGDVKPEMEVGSNDIPESFLGAKHFHLTTATPQKQLELIEFLRKNTNATISVDTIDEFASLPECKQVFDSVDIAFIDKEYTELLDSKAPVRIIKYGKQGCLYYSKDKSFAAHSQVIPDEKVIDKTGAGDCLNGVFLNLIANGTDEETALQTAVSMATESIKHKGIFELRTLEDKQNQKEVGINE
ncbi:MAG: carbohydrate kinase family protein [Clostridia bacterium]|nr:carbohydrate kinase family protein [Clostridia bacterium]